MAEVIVDFTSAGGNSSRLIGEYIDARDPGATGNHISTDAEMRETLRYTREFWEAYLEAGFRSPGVQQAGRVVYRVRLTPTNAGSASGSRTLLIVTGAIRHLRRSRDASIAERDRRLERARYRQRLAYALFQGVTASSDSPFRSMPSFPVGAAEIASYLLVGPDRTLLGSLRAFSQYLLHHDIPMFDRAWPDERTSSRGTPTLFWFYWVRRLGDTPEDPISLLRVFRRMYQERWSETTSVSLRNVNRLTARAGRFLGNGQSQVQMVDQNASFAAALLSPSLSFGGRGQVHARFEHGARFGPTGFRLLHQRGVRAVGDVLGQGRDQWVMQDSELTSLTIGGYDRSDGRGDATLQVYFQAHQGLRWGDWIFDEFVEVAGIGRFRDPHHSHLVAINLGADIERSIRVLGVTLQDETPVLDSVAIAPLDEAGSPSGSAVREDIRFAGSGRLARVGELEQMVFSAGEGSALTIVGVEDNRSRAYARIGIEFDSDRFGGGWRVKRGDEVKAIAALSADGDDGLEQIVLQSVEGHLGVVGLRENGGTHTFAVRTRGATIDGADGRTSLAWTWNETSRIAGVGRFLPEAPHRQQLLVQDADHHMGLLWLDGNRLVCVENTRAEPQADRLREVWAIGRFGLGKQDVAFGLHLNNHFQSIRIADGPAPGRGRWRRTGPEVHIRDGHFTSVFFQLEGVMRAHGLEQGFEALWRDFTISNLVSNMDGAPAHYTYPIAPSDRPQRVRADSVTGRQWQGSLQRWSARYLELPASTFVVRGEVIDAPHPVFWTLMVTDRNGAYGGAQLADGPRLRLTADLEENERLWLVISTTYADVDVSINLTSRTRGTTSAVDVMDAEPSRTQPTARAMSQPRRSRRVKQFRPVPR